MSLKGEASLVLMNAADLKDDINVGDWEEALDIAEHIRGILDNIIEELENME